MHFSHVPSALRTEPSILQRVSVASQKREAVSEKLPNMVATGFVCSPCSERLQILTPSDKSAKGSHEQMGLGNRAAFRLLAAYIAISCLCSHLGTQRNTLIICVFAHAIGVSYRVAPRRWREPRCAPATLDLRLACFFRHPKKDCFRESLSF